MLLYVSILIFTSLIYHCIINEKYYFSLVLVVFKQGSEPYKRKHVTNPPFIFLHLSFHKSVLFDLFSSAHLLEGILPLTYLFVNYFIFFLDVLHFLNK